MTRRRMSSHHRLMLLSSVAIVGLWLTGDMPAWIAVLNAGAIGLIVGEWCGRNCPDCIN